MSDQINHECGLALIRLLKPLDFYKKKYGSSAYGLNKLYLMLENNITADKMVLALLVLNWMWTRPSDLCIEKDLQVKTRFKRSLIDQIVESKMKKKKIQIGQWSH